MKLMFLYTLPSLKKRITNDLLTLNELDKCLRSFDQEDPVKYDFALFGLGVENEF